LPIRIIISTIPTGQASRGISQSRLSISSP